MSSTPKIAVITAASIGMVLTQSLATRAEKPDNSAPEKLTNIAAPIDEEVLYSALPDEVLEKAAAFGGFGACSAGACYTVAQLACNQGQQGQTVKRPPYVGLKYEDRKVPLGPTVAPKPTQGIKNK